MRAVETSPAIPLVRVRKGDEKEIEHCWMRAVKDSSGPPLRGVKKEETRAVETSPVIPLLGLRKGDEEEKGHG